MKQSFRDQNGRIIVDLDGSMFVEEALALRDKLLEYFKQGHRNYLINMTGVDYIDSSGLGTLVAIHKRALEHGGNLAIIGLRGNVKEIFELTRLTKVFDIQ